MVFTSASGTRSAAKPASGGTAYRQDAIATEAYLHTARRRVSVRRHAKLVDYTISDGCNARVWVAIVVGAAADGRTLPTGTLLATRAQTATIVSAAQRRWHRQPH